MAARTSITEEQRVRAAALFEASESVNKVAATLFNGNWAAAKKLHDEFYPKRQKGPRKKTEPGKTEPGAGKEPEPEAFDMTLQVPTACMDDILLRFSPQEKADAICSVLQGRLTEEA